MKRKSPRAIPDFSRGPRKGSNRTAEPQGLDVVRPGGERTPRQAPAKPRATSVKSGQRGQ